MSNKQAYLLRCVARRRPGCLYYYGKWIPWHIFTSKVSYHCFRLGYNFLLISSYSMLFKADCAVQILLVLAFNITRHPKVTTTVIAGVEWSTLLLHYSNEHVFCVLRCWSTVRGVWPVAWRRSVCIQSCVTLARIEVCTWFFSVDRSCRCPFRGFR